MESWMLDLGFQRSIASTRIAIRPQYSLPSALEKDKPYFGRRFSALQSPPVRYALLAALTEYVLRGKSAVRVLEIGAWAGASAITIGTVIQDLGISDSTIICIDPWTEYLGEGERSFHYLNMSAGMATGEIQRLFHHNTKVCGLERMIQIKKVCSREVLPDLKEGAFDLIYVDGSHKNEDVLYDLEQAKRLVKDGGFICGDDLELLKSQIDSGAHKIELEKGLDFVADPQSGVYHHPGVTEAIATEFNDVWVKNGLWCVKRSGKSWHAPVFQPTHMEIPNHLRDFVEVPYGVFGGYQFFQIGDEFIAYLVDDPYWFHYHLAENSLEELVLLVDAINGIDKHTAPRIVESWHGFNIVSYKRKGWVLHQSTGNVDFRNEEQLLLLKGSGHLFEANTIAEAMAEVNKRILADLEMQRPWWQRVLGVDPKSIKRRNMRGMD